MPLIFTKSGKTKAERPKRKVGSPETEVGSLGAEE